MLIEGFLVEPAGGTLPSRRLLRSRDSLAKLRSVFPDSFADAAGKPSTYKPREAEQS
jgi:hypothetical protein